MENSFGDTPKPLNEANHLAYIDGMKAPTFTSTGYEDFFSCAHTFREAGNRSWSQIGVLFSTDDEKRKSISSYHSYRYLFIHNLINPQNRDISVVHIKLHKIFIYLKAKTMIC